MKLATLCYIKDSGKTLMLHRIKKENDMHEGKWNGLGGKIDEGETPEECVIREVKEESGITIKNPVMKGILTFPAFDDNDEWRVFVFTASEYEGTPAKSNREGNLEWVDDDNILGLNLWEGDKYFLKWMNENKFFSAKFNYKNGRLVSHNVAFH